MTVNEIHQEIEETSERRAELWHILSQGFDPTAAAELKSLSQRLEQLWDEERTLKAELRFGNRDHIVARARVEGLWPRASDTGRERSVSDRLSPSCLRSPS